jgi:hypothetical protein
VFLAEADHAYVRGLAEREERSVSQVIRQLVREAIAARESQRGKGKRGDGFPEWLRTQQGQSGVFGEVAREFAAHPRGSKARTLRDVYAIFHASPDDWAEIALDEAAAEWQGLGYPHS